MTLRVFCLGYNQSGVKTRYGNGFPGKLLCSTCQADWLTTGKFSRRDYPNRALAQMEEHVNLLLKCGFPASDYKWYFPPTDGLCLFRGLHYWLRFGSANPDEEKLARLPSPEHLLCAAAQFLYDLVVEKNVHAENATLLRLVELVGQVPENDIHVLSAFYENPHAACATYMQGGWPDWNASDQLTYICGYLLGVNISFFYSENAKLTVNKPENYIFHTNAPLVNLVQVNNHYIVAVKKMEDAK